MSTEMRLDSAVFNATLLHTLRPGGVRWCEVGRTSVNLVPHCVWHVPCVLRYEKVEWLARTRDALPALNSHTITATPTSCVLLYDPLPALNSASPIGSVRD